MGHKPFRDEFFEVTILLKMYLIISLTILMYDNYLYPYLMFVVILQCKLIAFSRKKQRQRIYAKG